MNTLIRPGWNSASQSWQLHFSEEGQTSRANQRKVLQRAPVHVFSGMSVNGFAGLPKKSEWRVQNYPVFSPPKPYEIGQAHLTQEPPLCFISASI